MSFAGSRLLVQCTKLNRIASELEANIFDFTHWPCDSHNLFCAIFVGYNFHTTCINGQHSFRGQRKPEYRRNNPNIFGPLTNLPDYSYMDGRPTPLGVSGTRISLFNTFQFFLASNENNSISITRLVKRHALNANENMPKKYWRPSKKSILPKNDINDWPKRTRKNVNPSSMANSTPREVYFWKSKHLTLINSRRNE